MKKGIVMGKTPSIRLSKKEKELLKSVRKLNPAQQKGLSKIITSYSRMGEEKREELYRTLKRAGRILERVYSEPSNEPGFRGK